MGRCELGGRRQVPAEQKRSERDLTAFRRRALHQDVQSRCHDKGEALAVDDAV